MSTNSLWFYTSANIKTGIVILAHGLNLKPSKMDQLACFFSAKGCDVLRIELGRNPNLWSKNFHYDYVRAALRAKEELLPMYFVGFSLGALVGVHYMLTHTDHQFQKVALLAPACHAHWYTFFPAMLGHIFPWISLPSFNLADYREGPSTTLLEYKKMHGLAKEVQKHLQVRPLDIPLLLIYSPKDELVSHQSLKNWAKSEPQCTSLEISNQTSQLPKKYHHLMIDELTLGPKDWEKLIHAFIRHFSL